MVFDKESYLGLKNPNVCDLTWMIIQLSSRKCPRIRASRARRTCRITWGIGCGAESREIQISIHV
jgi:hypothetical protein